MSSLEETPEQASAPTAKATGRTPSIAYNEAFQANGQPRAHWKTLLGALERLGWAEIAVRAENGRRLLREHGSSSNSSRPEARSLELDSLPLVFGAQEWAQLVAGLVQRARLLNIVLNDLYSVQRLVRDGFVPAPLIYANPGYLRACQAIQRPGAAYLQSYAADLVRSPDGSWRVLADRTQSPTGLGFALEARTISARVLPEVIREVQPQPLANTMRLRQDIFRRLAPQHVEHPTVVLLTPGPRNDAYFEHAYVARLLGIALVEGQDLSVRDRRVFLKSLDGLRPVDVIVRRINDTYCDPLELRPDSLLGVSGLVEATRAGHVAVANALGSGLLESPAFFPFLPALCRHLLGEKLHLESISTWWCGQRRESNYVREHSEELVIRPAFHLGRHDVARDGQIQARSHEWVGQEPIRPSRAPVLVNGKVKDRPFVLRVFVLCDGQDYFVVPGGLASVVDESTLTSLTLPLVGLCKDLWILPEQKSSSGGGTHVPVHLAPVVESSASDLPSRTADNFFWLGRYAERLERIARIARCVVNRLSDEAGPASEARYSALGSLLASLDLVLPPKPGAVIRDALEKEVLRLLYRADRAFSVGELVARIQAGASSLRHRLSVDTWGILSRIGQDLKETPGPLPLVQASRCLDALVFDLAAFSGMEMENITRGYGWVFLDLGRRIERGLGLTRLLSALVVHQSDLETLFEPVLEIADSIMTYRWRYFELPRLDGVLELVLLEPMNPRSLAFQVRRLEEHAASLPSGSNPEGVAKVRLLVEALAGSLRELDKVDLADLAKTDFAHPLLQDLDESLSQLSELLTQVFFSHVQPRVS